MTRIAVAKADARADARVWLERSAAYGLGIAGGRFALSDDSATDAALLGLHLACALASGAMVAIAWRLWRTSRRQAGR